MPACLWPSSNIVTCIAAHFALFCFSKLKEKRWAKTDVTVVFSWAGRINTFLGKSFLFGLPCMQACQVSEMDWSVIIRGARPSEAREFARGVRGHAPPPGQKWIGV